MVRPTPLSGPPFEFIGGDLSLDFANTTDARATEHPQEQLTAYERLVQWGTEAGVTPNGTAEHLRRLAAAVPARAVATLRDALRLREGIYEVFAAVAQRRTLPGPAIATLNEFVRRAAGHLHLVPAGRRVSSEWVDPGQHLDSVLWPVSRGAAGLLTGAQVEFVRECASDTCSWLFLDQSKNHRRRWCDMKVCGNRDKARRYYERMSS